MQLIIIDPVIKLVMVRIIKLVMVPVTKFVMVPVIKFVLHFLIILLQRLKLFFKVNDFLAEILHRYFLDLDVFEQLFLNPLELLFCSYFLTVHPPFQSLR